MYETSKSRRLKKSLEATQATKTKIIITFIT